MCDSYEFEIKVDSNAAQAFFHRRGTVGRMKHIDSRILWLQDLIAAGGVSLKKTPRTLKLGRHVDAYSKCEGTGRISSVDESHELQLDENKVLLATREFDNRFQLEIRRLKLAWPRERVEFNCVFQPCTSRLYSA